MQVQCSLCGCLAHVPCAAVCAVCQHPPGAGRQKHSLALRHPEQLIWPRGHAPVHSPPGKEEDGHLSKLLPAKWAAFRKAWMGRQTMLYAACKVSWYAKSHCVCRDAKFARCKRADQCLIEYVILQFCTLRVEPSRSRDCRKSLTAAIGSDIKSCGGQSRRNGSQCAERDM